MPRQAEDGFIDRPTKSMAVYFLVKPNRALRLVPKALRLLSPSVATGSANHNSILVLPWNITWC